jgi:hypothetical protein
MDQFTKLRQMVSKGCASQPIIDTTSLPRSLMNRTQSTRFIDLVVDSSKLLNMIRVERVDHCRGSIQRLDLCNPVTEGACTTSCPTTHVPSESELVYDLEKYRSAFDLTHDFLECNIEGSSAQQTIMDMFRKRIAMDSEIMAIRSDGSLATGPGQSQLNNMLGVNDGFYKLLSDCVPACQIVDAGAKAASKYLFHEMLRRIPAKYRVNRAQYVFLMSSSTHDNLRLDLSDRETTAGDSALLQGNSFSPWGIRAEEIYLFPEDLPIDTDGDNIPDRNEGTTIWLTPLDNLVYIIQRDFQLESERIPRKDKWEFTMHWKADFMVADPGRVVMAKNVWNCGTPFCNVGCVSCPSPCNN